MRVEADKPTQLPIDSVFHFGASTRNYIIRERPQTGSRPIIEELEKSSEDAEGGLLGLPETETELDVSIAFESSNCLLLAKLFHYLYTDRRFNIYKYLPLPGSSVS